MNAHSKQAFQTAAFIAALTWLCLPPITLARVRPQTAQAQTQPPTPMPTSTLVIPNSQCWETILFPANPSEIQSFDLRAVTALDTGDVWAVGSQPGSSAFSSQPLIM